MSARDALLGAAAGAVFVGAAGVGIIGNDYFFSRRSLDEAQTAILLERLGRVRAEGRLAMEHREVVFLERVSDEYQKRFILGQGRSVSFIGRCDD